MTKSNSLFSKEAKNQLEALKKQLGTTKVDKNDMDSKPNIPVSLPSKAQLQKQLKKRNKQINQQHNQSHGHHKQVDNSSFNHSNDELEITEDGLLFEQAMLGVKPLQQKNTIHPEKLNVKSEKTDNVALAKRAAALGEDAENSDQPISDMQALLNPVASEAYLMYKAETLPNTVFNKLKTGSLRWFEAVDIHGSTIEEAREAVLKVIDLAKEQQQSVLKIVHGKGKDATLKTCVNGWLRQHDEVLAFCSAPNKDGGTGAVLVMIKRS